jgi:hypothetical protein
VIENFIGTKSRKKILEELKGNIDIFIGTKNIFNPIFNQQQIYKLFVMKIQTIIPKTNKIKREERTKIPRLVDLPLERDQLSDSISISILQRYQRVTKN